MAAIIYNNTDCGTMTGSGARIFIPSTAYCTVTTDVTSSYTGLMTYEKHKTYRWPSIAAFDETNSCTAGEWLDYSDNSTSNIVVKYDRWCNEVSVVYRGSATCWEDIQCLPQVPVAEKIKKIIQERCAPAFIRDRKGLDKAIDIREIRARETLCRVIGEYKYQDFIKKGFISVRGKSGLTYQIFPAHGITNVYNRGNMVERLCVVLQGDFPPTDSLIMRYLMILNNEDQFRGFAVKHSVYKPYKAMPKQPDSRSLTEIFSAFKGRKAA